ncbi:MAG: crosslink repair DNA glycosylase YcaQ family protein [Comamonas sp.]
MLHPQQLRRLALSRQGLGARQAFGQGLAGSLRAIVHLGYVQIDTLSVVERAHHHVLWSRVPGYALEHLNQLTSSGQIFEYWFHAAAYLPMRDYRFALPRMQSFRRDESPYFKNVDPKLMAEILARIRGDGELRTRDLKEQNTGPWWGHGPGRRALDKLFMQGALMIRDRKGMEKRYVLPEHLLPADANLAEPSAEEMAQYLLATTTRAHGVVTLGQLLHLRSGKLLRNAMRDLLAEQVNDGKLIALDNAMQPDTYVCTKALETDRLSKTSPAVQLLSPFDNAVIHRERLLQLFGYHYRLESYVPVHQRVHGYFCLPILWQGSFVGRIDCKANRAAGRFDVIRMHLEPGMSPTTQFTASLADAINQLAAFCGCAQVEHNTLT